MPSDKVLLKKKEQVKEISEKLKKAKSFVIADYRGINVEDDTKLRKNLREKGVEYEVIKNTLLSFAAKENGIEIEEHLSGPTAIAISYDDVIAPSKVLSDYLEDNENYKLKVGYLEGKILSIDEIKYLAKLPSREELIAKMLGSMQAPISGLVNVLNGNIRGLACVLNAIAKQKA